MRKSKLETAETRRRIVEVAARRFRSQGIHATGLSDLMSEAGLTHGGFYRHFESKDQLVAEACGVGFESVIEAFEDAASKAAEGEAFKSIVGSYVSTSHRDSTTGGCPIAGMGSELAHGDEATRAAAAKGFNDMVDVLAKRIRRRNADASHSDAVFAMAAMIGAVTLSRIIADPEASASVLQTVKQHLGAD
ncbi:TetR/AcrR family transcriptional regulator, transcriptional repressor for nem operon [Pararobbsia alpina]|uniref:TetR/AcrR family transcriptional regulator n=1 Tax=Pararobbsia alpina TaxID=621374 RepID=UPI0039A4FF61